MEGSISEKQNVAASYEPIARHVLPFYTPLLYTVLTKEIMEAPFADFEALE